MGHHDCSASPTRSHATISTVVLHMDSKNPSVKVREDTTFSVRREGSAGPAGKAPWWQALFWVQTLRVKLQPLRVKLSASQSQTLFSGSVVSDFVLGFETKNKV